MSLDDSSLNRYVLLYGDHFKHAKSGAYLLDYSEQRYLHFDQAASRVLTGYNNSYLLSGGLEAGLGLWDKNDLEVYDQQILPANLDFLASIPVEKIPKYLFECTYKVKNKDGELKTVLQKSFFLHSTDKNCRHWSAVIFLILLHIKRITLLLIELVRISGTVYTIR